MAKIIIVEDEKIIAEDIKWTLINFGYDVVGMVSEPEDILPTVREIKPDLILMDIKLGNKFEGVDAATRIKNELNLPVVFLTAYSDSDTIKKVLTSTPYGYLLKPYNEKELRATIEMALLRHKMEIALTVSEKKYRNLVENLQEGIVLIDSSGNIKFINQRIREILNLEEDEILNHNISEISNLKMHNEITIDRLKQKKMEIRIKDKYLEIHPSPYYEDNDHKGYLLVINDITELRNEEKKRKKTMQKLKSIESRMATILQNLPHVVIYETTGKDMYLSSNIEKLLGYKPDEFSKNPLFYMSLISNDDVEIYKKKFKKWKTDNYLGTLTRWYKVKRKDGEYIWVEEKMVKIANSSESSFMGIIVDITNIKKAEEEKKQMQKILLVSQKMEIVGKLAGGIAHDFNNLLMVINGLSEKLLNKIPSDDPNYQAIAKIHKSGEKASQLVNKLMGFSRRQISNPRIIDINKHLLNFWDILSQIIKSDISLVSDLSSECLKIKMDPVQFEQVIMNLVVNAKDAISNKGIIKIKTYKESVADNIIAVGEIIKSGNYVVMEVSDTGSGIKPEHLERIFEPFFTTKKKSKGTGLGLSSVFGIIKQNKGYITVQSEVNKGTTFKIYFPEASKAHTRKKKNHTILFIDDEKDILDFIKEILTDNGNTVYAFDSPVKALDFYKNSDKNVDIVITDFTMPEMNGSELIAMLKSVRDDFKTIFITGYADTELFQNSLDNTTWVLPKPFTPRELLDFLENLYK